MHSDATVIINGCVLTAEQAWVLQQALQSLYAQVGNALQVGACEKPFAAKVDGLCVEALRLFEKQVKAAE